MVFGITPLFAGQFRPEFSEPLLFYLRQAAGFPHYIFQLRHLPLNFANIWMVRRELGLQFRQDYFELFEACLGIRQLVTANDQIRFHRGQLTLQINLPVFRRLDLIINLLDFSIETLRLLQIELLQFRQNPFIFRLKLGDLGAQSFYPLLNFPEFRLQKLGGGFRLSFPDFQILFQIQRRQGAGNPLYSLGISTPVGDGKGYGDDFGRPCDAPSPGSSPHLGADGVELNIILHLLQNFFPGELLP